MSRLVDGLSAVARLADPAHQPTLTELSAAEVITAAAAEVALEAELRSVSIDLDVDGSLLLRGDAEELVLALRNLLGNAIKHAPEGTAVSISAHGDGPAVRVLVRDLGPGFPAHEAPRLFEKYYRAAAERERGLAGSGLGLFIVTSVARPFRNTRWFCNGATSIAFSSLSAANRLTSSRAFRGTMTRSSLPNDTGRLVCARRWPSVATIVISLLSQTMSTPLRV